MRDHLATLLEDFRSHDREIAVVRFQGNRRRVSTYGEIARLAGRFAALLAARNIGPGDRVVLWAENSAEWIAAFHGCILRGVLVVPLDAYGTPEFAARVAADVQPSLAVGDAMLLRRFPQDDPRFAFSRIAFEDWATALPAEEAGPVPGLNRVSPLQILFTSGTTGEPKGIVHTHGNVLASIGPIERGAQRYLRYEKYVHPLRFLHTLPLSHVFGQTMGLWIPPIFRAEVHFESRLVAPRLIETIRRERISVLAAVPRVFALIKTHLETSHPQLIESIAASQGIRAWKRWWRFREVHRVFGFKFWALISGGGALPSSVEHFWNALGFVLVQGYGMTETTALITLNHPFHVASGTIGKPLPGREVKIGPDGEVLVRGPMISSATWQGGQLRQREDEWLATGDLAETQATGELRFLGRKSEVIVTGAGVNIHPEDLEAAIEEQPQVAACAVVAVETPSGPEPCAVLAMRGASNAAAAIERANAHLAEFQRVRRWMIWPEPDLPRTSTGKVRRKAVAEWLATSQAGVRDASRTGPAASDWLLTLIAQITGETPPAADDTLRLAEDFHLDSLGRVQLAAAIEEKLGMPPESGFLEQVHTLGDLRRLLAVAPHLKPSTDGTETSRSATGSQVSAADTRAVEDQAQPSTHSIDTEPKRQTADRFDDSGSSESSPSIPSPQTFPPLAEERRTYVYPQWPWTRPIHWIRVAFVEAIMRPLVWLLANPRVVAQHASFAKSSRSSPFLIVANHVTTYDGPLVQYALPGPMRRRIAAAMSGEMLDDYRHFRNPERGPDGPRFSLFGPCAYYLLTALFNVFPLPRLRNFQRSFSHAGEALDSGYHVLVFPEGTRSVAGQLARFSPGIGLLAKQSGTAVLPVAIRGLGELKTGKKRWFRSGNIEVRVGEPLSFAPEITESEITARLHAEIEKLLNS